MDDGVGPNYLVVPEGNYGEIVGVQVHAIRSQKKTEILYFDQKAIGRSLTHGSRKYITLTGITGNEFDQEQQQATDMFKKADLLLKQVGADMHSVARTWIWLKDILKWYEIFNKVRTQFYIEKELIKTFHPALNLTGWKNIYRPRVELLRKACADEARNYAG